MITSPSNPRIKQIIQWQTKAKERKKDDIFLVEGYKMYQEAPVSRIRQVYVSESFLAKAGEHPGVEDKLRQTGFETVTDEIFRKMSDTQTPQGVLCVVSRPQYRMEDLINVPQPLIMILENLQDPGNLGTIMRTGEGAGITGVIMSKQTVDLFNPKTIRATMGSIYRVPFLYVDDLSESLERLHENGITSYAAHLEGSEYYDRFSYRQGTAFLIGNEGNGLTPELSAKAKQYLKIPMEGQVESLNAAVASAVLMYEAHRQRSL